MVRAQVCISSILVSVVVFVSTIVTAFSGTLRADQAGEKAQGPPVKGKQAFAEAIRSYRRGLYAEAIEGIVRSLQTYRVLEEYQNGYLLRAHRKAGNCEQVLHLAADFEKRFPTSMLLDEVLEEEASCLQELSRYSSAAALYKRLLERPSELSSSQRRQLQFKYANLLKDMGRIKESVSLYMSLRRQWPGTKESMKAREQLLSIYERYPGIRDVGRNALLQEAHLLLAEGEVSQSLSMYRSVINKQPEDRELLDAYFGETQCLVRSGNLTEAEGTIAVLVANYPEAPQTPKAMFTVGKGFWLRDRGASARRHLETVLEQYTDSEEASQAAYILGRIFLEEGNLPQAAKQFKETRLLFPQSLWGKEAGWYEAWTRYLGGEYDACAAVLGELLLEGGDTNQTPKALYWRARCLDRMGQRGESERTYGEILRNYPDNYYRVLAEKRLGDRSLIDTLYRRPQRSVFPPLFVSRPLQLPDALIRELLDVGLTREAVERMDRLKENDSHVENYSLELIKAYYRAGAYPAAILLAHTEISRLRAKGLLWESDIEKDLMSVAYPLFYWELIQRHASRAGLDPLFVASLIHQESHFVSNAVSPAGAVGLMQILPRTGKRVASKVGVSIDPPESSLEDPDTNILLGTTYLAELAKDYGNDWIKVLAVYNAGEAALHKWLSRHPTMERDEFVEAITYPETQKYIKKVLSKWERYKELFGDRSVASETVSR